LSLGGIPKIKKRKINCVQRRGDGTLEGEVKKGGRANKNGEGAKKEVEGKEIKAENNRGGVAGKFGLLFIIKGSLKKAKEDLGKTRRGRKCVKG
jgi:hypothetical protein